MNRPAVSILLPVRNEAEFLSAALFSMSRQTFTDWELIAVDDGSTDATPELLARAAQMDFRIQILPSPGTGLVAALNAGLTRCRAPLVARMDGDDISHPRRLERQAAFLDENPGIGLLASTFRHFPRQSLRIGMRAYEQWQNALTDHDAILRDLFVESPFVHPSVMFRRREVELVGGYREMGWAEDYDLWLRLAAAGTRFARLPQTLFFWRDRPQRSTRTMREYTAEAFRACKVHHLKRKFLQGHDSVILAGAGKEGRAWRRALVAEGIAVLLWVDVDPRKVGRILHGVPVVSPAAIAPGYNKMLLTIGTRGARQDVRRWAVEAGFMEGTDYMCVT